MKSGMNRIALLLDFKFVSFHSFSVREILSKKCAPFRHSAFRHAPFRHAPFRAKSKIITLNLDCTVFIKIGFRGQTEYLHFEILRIYERRPIFRMPVRVFLFLFDIGII